MIDVKNAKAVEARDEKLAEKVMNMYMAMVSTVDPESPFYNGSEEPSFAEFLTVMLFSVHAIVSQTNTDAGRNGGDTSDTISELIRVAKMHDTEAVVLAYESLRSGDGTEGPLQ